MNTEDILLISLTKKEEHLPWFATMEAPSGLVFETTMGPGGNTTAGPTLSDFFIELERSIVDYPYTYSLTSLSNAKARSVRVRFLSNKPVYSDMLLTNKKYLLKNKTVSIVKPRQELVDMDKKAPYFSQKEQMNARAMFSEEKATNSLSVKNERTNKENKYWIFFDSQSLQVLDGDTFSGYMLGYSWPKGMTVPNKIGEQPVTTQTERATVSYLGVEAFTLSGATLNLNKNKAKNYGLTEPILNKAGEQAFFYNQSLIESKKIIAVSVQYDTSNNLAVPNSEKHIHGVAYATDYQTWEDAKSAAEAGTFKGINLNKEMLKPMYSDFKGLKEKNPASVLLPLAEYTGFTQANPKGGIKISSWGHDLQLAQPPLNAPEIAVVDGKKPNIEVAFEEALKESTYKNKGGVREETSIKGYINNDLSFVPPYDDRLLKGKVYKPTYDLDNELAWDYRNKVRIGDVFIPIPPLSIRVDKQFQNEKVTTMRAKSSLQKQVGSVRNILSMDLYYHDLESINGTQTKAYTTDEGEEIFYYMDGLRSLLAQFKKAPFLPIDNEYINASLGIKNVAMRSINASTVPGFPEAMKVTLIVEEFDSSPYLMGAPNLGDKINYPLLRWHYQRLLHEPALFEPWRTFLPKIDRLDNSFTFSIADEDELIGRKSALHEFRTMKTPYDFERGEMDLKTDEGQKSTDGKNVKQMLTYLTKFEAEFKSKKLSKEYPKKYMTPLIIGEGLGWDAFNDSLTGDMGNTVLGGESGSILPSERKLGKKLAIALYGERDTGVGISKDKPFFDMGMLSEIFKDPANNAFYTYRTVSSGKGLSGTMLGGARIPSTVAKDIKEANLPGYFQVFLENEEHKKMFKGLKVKKGNDNGGGSKKSELFLIPAGDVSKKKNYLTKLKQIASVGKELEEKVKVYNYEYNALAAQINRTEEDMGMTEVEIKDLVPLDLSVSMESNFSEAQFETATTPALQFFGSNDPQLQLTFETTDRGVKEVEAMFRKVGEYVKNYREGIVSGFMAISNPLVNMFGIRTVLPEAVQYNTVAGFPDRKIVTISFSAFDKTQRRQESLYGYTAGDTNEVLRDRAFDKYDPAIDSIYMHEKMRQMELYPDLEMGKISELNSALKSIDAKMKKWENRTDQVFLDPDFYISTASTYRNFIKDIIDDSNGITFRFEDASGLKAESVLSEGNPLKMDDASIARYEKEADEADYIDPTLEWKKNGEEKETEEEEKKEPEEEEIKTPKAVISKPAEYKNKDVKEYMSSKAYQKMPSFETWNKWHGGNKTEAQFKKWAKFIKTPQDETKAWLYLADCIMTSFSGVNLKYAKGEKKVLTYKKRQVESGRLVDAYQTDKALGKQVWSDPVEYFKASYSDINNLRLSNPTGVFSMKKDMKNGSYSKYAKVIDEGSLGIFSGFKAAKDAYDTWFTDMDEMPFQRIMSYLKAVIVTESKWQQFEGGKPHVYDNNASDKLPTKVGIMGARLTKAESKEEAERLVWDWRYNIKKSVEQMVEVYKKAEKSDYKELFIRRLDWAVVSHSGIEMPAIISSNSKKDDVADGFSGGMISPDASSYFLAVMNKRKVDISSATSDSAPGIYMNGLGNLIKPVFNLYNDFDLETTIGGNNLDKEDANYSDKQKEAFNDKYEQALADEVKQMSNNMENWTTEEKVKGMFVDMYQHDQTGRMIRAFPSFSFQIVDEGKWYNNFRTWDNFYGYNALHSIDVYKSRKVAADTATIEMSNMYGGLSTKRKDMEYEDLIIPSVGSPVFWEQDVLNMPTAEILADRKEIFKSMMLETGARVSLRMGYGSDARYLPETFNGVITEVDTGDIVTITAQGDALELTNVISGSEKDTNKEFLKVIEPSDYIGKLLTSKGNWLKDMMSDSSDGKLFREHPLGIVHFGADGESPDGTWNPFSSEYGEAVQNVYSQNGQFTKEQWMKPDGSKVGVIKGLLGGLFDGQPFNLGNLTSENDEDNIRVNLYGNTVWDIVQTFALCSMDYVAAVFPMENRSSLFFGKPIWPVTYKYDKKFTYDEGSKTWRKEIVTEHKKTFMQAHVYSSAFNIISNDIKVSEEGLFNNVIVTYDGKMAGPLQADNDIRLDRQKTTVVEADIVASWGADGNAAQFFGKNYWTVESQALKYGMSTVRDNMKDMYKGTYTVLGDPSVKPHDVCFLSDTVLDIQGIHMVKAVHHSMSAETGFITHIEPDAYVVNFDAEMLFMADKIFAVGQTTVLRAAASAMNLASSYLFGGSVMAKMFENLTSLASMFPTQLVTKYTDGIVNAVQSNFAKEMGRRANSQYVIGLSDELRKGNLTKIEIDLINRQMRTAINKATALKRDMKLKKKALKSAKRADGIAKSFGAVNNGLGIDDIKVMSQLTEAYNDFDTAAEAYKVSKAAGNAGKVSQTTVKVAKTMNGAVKKGGQMAFTLAKSANFWTLVAEVGLEVATSGLVEMWSRNKQNSECVKVVPLKYKGTSWTAGMNGHRGGVWGDNPSLADRIYDAEFGGGDKEIDSMFWTILPKIMNALE